MWWYKQWRWQIERRDSQEGVGCGLVVVWLLYWEISANCVTVDWSGLIPPAVSSLCSHNWKCVEWNMIIKHNVGLHNNLPGGWQNFVMMTKINILPGKLSAWWEPSISSYVQVCFWDESALSSRYKLSYPKHSSLTDMKKVSKNLSKSFQTGEKYVTKRFHEFEYFCLTPHPPLSSHYLSLYTLQSVDRV